VSRIETALSTGKIEQAEKMIAQLEASNPRAPGLDRVKEKLAAMQESLSHQHRILETEQVLNQYLQRKQVPLARLALETLCELSPAHPKRAHYEGWLGMLAEEVERDKRAEAALAAGRAALARKDLKAARRELENIARSDPSGKRAEVFNGELEAAEREARQDAEAEEHVRRLEKALAEHRVADAERELAGIAKLDLPRVTLDSYRQRVAEARSLNAQQEKASRLEWLFRKHLEERDWFRARETAVEMGQTFPGSARSTEMFAEAERLEAEHRKEQAVEQGVRQVEAFVAQGDAAKAELALKILIQMDPENRHRKRLEKQVRAMPR
jgi:Tfp pilus assembly protein PilF